LFSQGLPAAGSGTRLVFPSGYLNELKLSKKVLLLPGDHTISVRQNGYQDFSQTIVVQPGETHIIRVAMNKAPTGPMPPDAELATIKINVNPSRAQIRVLIHAVGWRSRPKFPRPPVEAEVFS
jgi:hypothetical protein